MHHGFVVAFAGGSIDHDGIAFNLRRALTRLFPAPCRSFGSDVKVRVAATEFFYADAGVVSGEVDLRASFIDAPRLVAEVLSRSTHAYDVAEKRVAYRATPSLDWYVVEHTDARRIEGDAREPGGRWSTAVFDEDEAFLGDRVLALDVVYAGSLLEREAM